MAVPTLVNVGTQVDGLGSVTPPHPTGLATDDLKLIFISNRMSPGDDLSTHVPTGWTLRWRLERTSGHEAACYYRFHVGGDTAPTITSSSDDLIAEMVAFRGVDTTTPFDVTDETHGFAAGTSTMTAFAAITTVTDHCLALGYFDSADDNAIGTPSAGWSQVYGGASYDSTTNADGAHALISKEITPAGSTGTPSMEQTVNSPDGYIVVLMALRPVTADNVTVTPGVLTGTGSQADPTKVVTSNAAPSVLGTTGAGQAPTVKTNFGPAAITLTGTGSQATPSITTSTNLASGAVTGTGSFPAPGIDIAEPDAAAPFHFASEPPPPIWWLVAETGGETRIISQWDALELVQPVGPESDTISLKMLADDVIVQEILELQTDLHVYRNAVWLATGRVVSMEDSFDGDTATVSIAAIDYREILANRAAWNFLEYVQVDKGQIVWNVIQHTQGLNSGNLGITQGVTTTGVLGDLTVQIGAYLKKALDEYGLIGAGYDWWITPDKQLMVQSPRRYRDRNAVILEHGSTLKSLSRSTTSSDYTNAVRVFGGDETTSATASQLPDPRGRWERVESFPDIKIQQTVVDKTAELLTAGQSPLGAWVAAIESSRWGYSVDLDPGDVCTLRVKRGRLNVDRLVRLVERSFSIDADGKEEIKVGLREEPEVPVGRGPAVRTHVESSFVDMLTDMRLRIEVLEREGGGGGLPGPGGETDPGGGGDPGTGDIDDDMIEILTYSWDRGEFNLQGGASTRFPDGGDDTADSLERFTRLMFPGSAVLWTPGRATLDLHNVEAAVPASGISLLIRKRTAAGVESTLGTLAIATSTAADSPSERKAIFTSITCTGSVGPTDVVFYQLDTVPSGAPNLYAAELKVYGVYS